MGSPYPSEQSFPQTLSTWSHACVHGVKVSVAGHLFIHSIHALVHAKAQTPLAPTVPVRRPCLLALGAARRRLTGRFWGGRRMMNTPFRYVSWADDGSRGLWADPPASYTYRFGTCNPIRVHQLYSNTVFRLNAVRSQADPATAPRSLSMVRSCGSGPGRERLIGPDDPFLLSTERSGRGSR